MSEKLTVKYYVKNKSANEPVQASENAAGYGLYSAEAKTLCPHSCTGITLELRMAILKGNYGKIFPRSGILRDHFITCDSGVIDADYRGTVVILLINHSSEHYTVRVDDIIAQMVFMRKFNVNFEEVSCFIRKIRTRYGRFGLYRNKFNSCKETFTRNFGD